MRRWLPLTTLLLFLFALAAPLSALADETDDLEETDDLPVVQNRLFRTNHALSIGAGVLPIGAFYKGFLLTGGYAWHINDTWAVEARGAYVRPFKTSLREDLEGNFTIPPTRFAELRWYTQGGVLFKPLYGKLSLFNDSLVYGELYFSAHGVFGQMEGGRADDENPQGKGKEWAFGGAPGFGLRGYLHEYISARFDFRPMIVYSAGEMHYPLELTLTFTFTTRGDL